MTAPALPSLIVPAPALPSLIVPALPSLTAPCTRHRLTSRSSTRARACYPARAIPVAHLRRPSQPSLRRTLTPPSPRAHRSPLARDSPETRELSRPPPLATSNRLVSSVMIRARVALQHAIARKDALRSLPSVRAPHHRTAATANPPQPQSQPSTPDAQTHHESQDATTHFGFSSVPLSDKQSMVGQVFERVAPSYDLMNDAMSLRVHRLWKRAFVASLDPTPAMRILDCAGGTGDIAFRVIESRQYAYPNATTSRTARTNTPHPTSSHSDSPHQPVIVCDINKDMLAVGQQRARQLGLTPDQVRFVEANAENLPIATESIDAYLISFGMRNVPRPQVALAEAMRVLRPGGRFMMLEFAEVSNPVVKRAYDAYSFNVIPELGAAIANDRESYRYLVESIRQFPKQDEFAAMMAAAGLRDITVTDYSFGIAAQYSGFKPAAPST